MVTALSLIPAASSASKSVLQSREHRQVRALHKYVGTRTFFKHRPWLARTRPGREALRVAHVWLPILRRELSETRAALKPRYPWSASWLAAATCIHQHEGAWNSNTGNGYFGGMQFLLGTWASVGGTVRPDLASPQEQLYRAFLVWQRDGGSFREWGTAGSCGV